MANTTAPCISEPRRWDLDQGGVYDWLRAIADCQQRCPRLGECRRDLAAPDIGTPRAAVQAGIAFGSTGTPLTIAALRRRAARRERDARLPDGNLLIVAAS